MATAVSRQEDDLSAVEFSVQEMVGGRTERSCHRDPAFFSEGFDIVEAAASYDSDPMHGDSFFRLIDRGRAFAPRGGEGNQFIMRALAFFLEFKGPFEEANS